VSLTITISGVIGNPGIYRKRNKALTFENVAEFAHFSVRFFGSKYARTLAKILSPLTAKPSLSFVGVVDMMSMKVLNFRDMGNTS
jgi:hypothetical protein